MSGRRHAIVLDLDGTLLETGADVPGHEVLAALAGFRSRGGRTWLLSGRAESHLRVTVAHVPGADAFGECGYMTLGASTTQLHVPRPFLEAFGEVEEPRWAMRSHGVEEWALQLTIDDVATVPPGVAPSSPAFTLHRSDDRRVTLCLRTPWAIDFERLNARLWKRFGPTVGMFENGSVGLHPAGELGMLPMVSTHIAPRDPARGDLLGKAWALAQLRDRNDLDVVHFGGDSLHDLHAGLAAGVRTFGVANCQQPDLWRNDGAMVMHRDAGEGVADYVTNLMTGTHPVESLEEHSTPSW